MNSQEKCVPAQAINDILGIAYQNCKEINRPLDSLVLWNHITVDSKIQKKMSL